MIELLLSFAEAFRIPTNNRLLLAAFGVGSLALSAASMQARSSASGLDEWRLALLAGAAACGAGCVLVSVLHLRREASDRVLSMLCLTSGVAAISIALAGVLGG